MTSVCARCVTTVLLAAAGLAAAGPAAAACKIPSGWSDYKTQEQTLAGGETRDVLVTLDAGKTRNGRSLTARAVGAEEESACPAQGPCAEPVTDTVSRGWQQSGQTMGFTVENTSSQARVICVAVEQVTPTATPKP
jgi:hypothetical protein